MIPQDFFNRGKPKGQRKVGSTPSFPSWASGLESMGVDSTDENLVSALRGMPWKEMGFEDFTPLKAIENMNTEEYKKVKARLEAIREREAEERDTSRPLEEEPGGFALMLETTLDFYFLTPTLFLRPDGSFMFEPRKRDIARMAVILQSTDKGGGNNTNGVNMLSSGGVGLGIGKPEKEFKPSLMFVPGVMSPEVEGLLKHEQQQLLAGDEDDPYVPIGAPSSTLTHANGELVCMQPQPSDSTDPALKNKYKPHIPLGHKFIPKSEYSYDQAFKMCPIMCVSDSSDKGVQARIRLPGISLPLHVSGLPRLCASNMLFCLQRMYRMFGCRLPGGMQWANMCLRLEGSHRPLDGLDDMVPDADDEDEVGDAAKRTRMGEVGDAAQDGSVDATTGSALGMEMAINVDHIPTFILEPKSASVTVFVTNAPQPLVFGDQRPLPKAKDRKKKQPKAVDAEEDDDEEDDEDVDAFYANMVAAQKALPSDWKKQLSNYVPRRAVKRVVLEDLPKTFTIRDLKIAAASSAFLELTPLECSTLDLWRETREEVHEVPLEPEDGEDDQIAAIRRRLLALARRHQKSIPTLQGPARADAPVPAEVEPEPDLRKLPATALAPSDMCAFKWSAVTLTNDTPLWKLDLDCRGSEYNVFELQFDVNVCGHKSADLINAGGEKRPSEEADEEATASMAHHLGRKGEALRPKPIPGKSEYGLGRVTGEVVARAIQERQRRKMQQISYQKARDSGLLNSHLAEAERLSHERNNCCSTRMLLVYMFVYVVAVCAWWSMNTQSAEDRKRDVRLKETMKNIYGKKFDL